jgi:hypothetical protein
VNDVAPLLQLVAAAAIVVAPAVLARWLAGPEPVGLSGLFRFHSEPAWPTGVQEEEPVRWKVELIGRSGAAAAAPDCEPVRGPATEHRLRPIRST